ncbi:MAG: Asp-tRNA(Asn)/Glu-tRNA(Gln) amidotransferase subunit GatB [Candidatus Altiarchaeota archaeon]|nr:Asp-tRNA(Asn)/Glu-tRNA(Gln) amidotransferase subunit GatB [Candidatus Altiarchaeota archaeon]
MQDPETKPAVRIGLEIHVPLNTRQKLFCDCPTDYYVMEEPNVNVCPVCTGMPGAKPWPINERVIESAVMVAKLLNCTVAGKKAFVKRKHYDYPDLPSGYQRTSEPIGVEGELAGVGIWEVHFEEDPGRYDLASGRVDYNRSGVPLIEIVTAPDMKSPDDVRAFLKELVNLLKYTGRIIEVGGVMRADVNISLEGGARVEIKNINSVKGAYKAISYEIIRQTNLQKRGGTVVQETRGFNEKSMITTAMRVKETADDYRYIPDPDIPPLEFKESYVEGIALPETPQTRRGRLIELYWIPENYAQILVKDKSLADLFEEIAPETDPLLAADWMCREVLRQLNYRGIELGESMLSGKILIELFTMLKDGTVTENTGKKLLERVIDSGESPKGIVEKDGLGKVSEADELSRVAGKVLAENSQAAEDYRAGKKEALNYLMGQVMKEMRGRADSGVVIRILEEKLESH